MSSSPITHTAEAGVAAGSTGPEWVRAFGPASLSNLGPGFDAIGLCIQGIGDVVEARLDDEPGVRIIDIQPDSGLFPGDLRNTAARAASLVLQRSGSDRGIEMRILKQVPFGSGIGGSAASAVAGAWAANLLLGSRFEKDELVAEVHDLAVEAELLEGLVSQHQGRIDLDDPPETAAAWAGAEGRVEGKQAGSRRAEALTRFR